MSRALLVAPRSRAAEKLTGLPFVAVSYLLLTGAFVLARLFFLPVLVARVFHSLWCSPDGFPVQITLFSFIERALLLTVGASLVVELGLTGAWVRAVRR